jgi:hypothetical protein
VWLIIAEGPGRGKGHLEVNGLLGRRRFHSEPARIPATLVGIDRSRGGEPNESNIAAPRPDLLHVGSHLGGDPLNDAGETWMGCRDARWLVSRDGCGPPAKNNQNP